MLRHPGGMATSPISGALSPTRLAALEQIRALRAAKPVQPVPFLQAPAAPVDAKPAAAQPLATAAPPPGNRPRGSILNILA
jgi:hypothetical protein